MRLEAQRAMKRRNREISNGKPEKGLNGPESGSFGDGIGAMSKYRHANFVSEFVVELTT